MKTLLERRRWGLAAPSTVTATALTAASSAAVSFRNGAEGLVLLVLAPSVPCFIRFGDSTVTAATVADFPLLADTEYFFACGNDTTRFRVIRSGGADGLIDSYIVLGA